MWKWILGGVLVVIVLLVGTCWYGFRKFTAGGGDTSITIAGTTDAIWASLDDLDSLRIWATGDSLVGEVGHGPLVVGDSFVARPRQDVRDHPLVMIWTVLASDPGRTRVLEARDDSTRRVLIRRHDSLAVTGDSTTLFTRFTMPLADSLDSTGQSGGLGGALLRSSAKLMVSAMRVQAEFDLQRLKARVEGRAMPETPIRP